MENPQITINVPLVLPSGEELRELIREGAARAAEAQLRWLTDREACEFLRGISLRSWQRKRKALGIPVSEVDGRNLYLREDLEAVLLAHTSAPDTTVIAFPSQTLRKERAA